MSEKPTPEDMVHAMVEGYESASSVAQAPVPGTFAKQYADGIKDEVNADNVDVFFHGSATINVLVQEAILRVVSAAAETQRENSEDEGMTIYAEGVIDGAKMVAQIMAVTADDVLQHAIEDAAFEAVFNGIVGNI